MKQTGKKNQNENKKVLNFLAFGAICFILVFFDLLSLNIQVQNEIQIDLLYVPVFLSVFLLIIIVIEKLINYIFKK